MKNIYLIGAGQIGSRHLQALKKVKIPLDITVIDPLANSLETAKERYNNFAPDMNIHQKVIYENQIIKKEKDIDLAIVATSSNVRRQIIESLLKTFKVKNFILEKILFQKKEDHSYVDKLFQKQNIKAWVNCSMRTMPFYSDLKGKVGTTIQYFVTGSRFGLVTNAIHYIDHIAFLTNCYNYEVETKFLDPKVIQSKRKGFLELNGTLNLYFKNGSFGSITCYPMGTAPFVVEIVSNKCRIISRETERKAFISNEKNNWSWPESKTEIPFQSEMTTEVVEEILLKGKCILPSFEESSKLHIILLEALLKFLNEHLKKKINYYPFT